MGMWSGQQFRLKDNKKMSVITAYRPCHSYIKEQKILQATHHQQTIMFCKHGYKNPDPRVTFVDAMIALIKTLEAEKNHYIILMIDANESLNEKEHQLRRIIHDTSLVDAFTHHTGELCDIPTYEDGKKRIDYIFTTTNLLPFIDKVGYLAFGEDNIMSDHKGAFIDINENIIDNKIEFKRPAKRHIGSKSKPTIIFNYKKQVNEQFQLHNIYERADRIKLASEQIIDNKISFELELNNLDN